MVAVINTGKSISRALNYNEHKVKEGKAQLLAVSGYHKPANDLSFSAKLNRLERQAALNENVQRNGVHISLNFHNDDKLSTDQLQTIAHTYMEGIGFGAQPYLVYQHHDAGHKHLHIVTIKIDKGGNRIDMNNIGRGKSTQIREQIEHEYGLVKAKGRKVQEAIMPARIVRYGKTETKRAIANVLAHVLHEYNFTSLPELNAVLKAYNVRAETGATDSRLQQYGGLVYQVLSDKGEPVGVPIKASLFYGSPGLQFLKKKFAENEQAGQWKKRSIKTAVDLYFFSYKKMSIEGLTTQLKTRGIDVVTYKNPQGLLYGVTFVDHANKVVFAGSDLGKNYSAAALLQRFQQGSIAKEEKASRTVYKEPVEFADESMQAGLSEKDMLGNSIEALLMPDKQLDYVDPNLKRKKKKKI